MSSLHKGHANLQNFLIERREKEKGGKRGKGERKKKRQTTLHHQRFSMPWIKREKQTHHPNDSLHIIVGNHQVVSDDASI